MKKLWIASAVICTLLTVAFLALFLRAYYLPESKAVEAGKRVEINLKTGEIKQAAEKPAEEAKTEKVAEKEPEKKEEPEVKEEPKAKEEEPKKDAKEEPKHEEADKEKSTDIADVKPEEKPAAPKEAVAEIPKGPRIAIVIAGVGLSRSSTEQVFKLPPQVSFSFSPYASDITEWIKKAAEDKHEFYVDVPMEPKDYPHSDPGPYALLINLEDDKNMERLDQVLKSGEGYRGVVSGPDEHFTENTRAIDWLLNTLKGKKLSLFYVAQPANKQLTQEIETSKLPAQGIDFVLDEKLTNDAIDTRLAEAEALAEKSGFAVVLARPYPISVQRIQEWLKTLGPKGIHLVPLSQAKAQ